MKRFIVNNFARGMADDRYGAQPAEFGFSKHFDILTHPRRLQPLRGMAAHTISTLIGNIILASNGLMYGVGDTGSSNGKLWKLAGYGVSDDYAALSTNQLSGAAISYDFLVEWPDAGQTRTIHWASTNLLIASDPAGASGASTQALTFVSIGQGLVHPKDKNLYFPYQATATTPKIGILTPNGSPFGGLSGSPFALPSQYRAYCLSWYQNWLAVPLTTQAGTGIQSSLVGLWNRDTTATTFDETIPWGAGSLQVLNNLQGALIGISTASANFAGTFQDYDAVLIKVWEGGAEPIQIKEIKVPYLAGGTPTANFPRATINPRVNFVKDNRLYFSINLVPGDGVNPARYGLWSVGKNKVTGEWTVTQERVATNANTETGVIAAAMAGDFASIVHTAEGTLTKSNNGVQSSGSYNATSVFESGVNPGIDDADKFLKKKIFGLSVNTLPLPSGAQVVLKYRVDSTGADADWTTLRTYTTTGGSQFDIGAGVLTDGFNHEYRLESTGGAVILGFTGRYDIIQTNI